MNLLHSIRRKLSPLDGAVNALDYWKVRRQSPFKESTARLHGHEVRFSDAAGFLHSVEEIFLDEVYRFASRSDRPLIVDVGANIGLSLLYFKRMYPNASIIAFEPDPRIFELLKCNVASLHLNNIELHNSAAWVEDTTLTFYSEGSLAGSTEVDFLSKGNATIVKAERLKTFLRDSHIDFLKIDIEGAEHSVLFDIQEELMNVDRLFFEYHSQPAKPQMLGEMLNLVRQAGFRYSINGARGQRYPFIGRAISGFDLQLNIYCFRE